MLSTVLMSLSLSTATASEAAPEAETDASIQVTPTYAEFAADGQNEKIKRPLLAAGLNWFLPGAGYAYNNAKPLYVTLPMMAGAVGLTYVENFHQFENGTLREVDQMAWGVMFASVIVLNTGVAIDAFREAKAINRGDIKRRGSARRVDMNVSPSAFAGAQRTTYGLTLDARF